MAPVAVATLVFFLLAYPAWATSRNYAAKAEFKRLNPCPATAKKRGPCPGWEIDHVVPLKCRGDDLPANMQWLTVADHKDKTRREARLCIHPPAH